jgi:hypothetical protein|tara:strand:- start:1191 stop:1355 length:165 start_codon:yes stop_codon:yes gene_type:complete
MNDGIINEGAGIEKGENARMASFVGAIAIADLVKQVFLIDDVISRIHFQVNTRP